MFTFSDPSNRSKITRYEPEETILDDEKQWNHLLSVASHHLETKEHQALPRRDKSTFTCVCTAYVYFEEPKDMKAMVSGDRKYQIMLCPRHYTLWDETRPRTVQEEIANHLEDIANNLAELVEETETCSSCFSEMKDTLSELNDKTF